VRLGTQLLHSSHPLGILAEAHHELDVLSPLLTLLQLTYYVGSLPLAVEPLQEVKPRQGRVV
jgi:hypothetical protein